MHNSKWNVGATGKHVRRPERMSLRDYAIQTYASNLEGFRTEMLPDVVKEAYTELEQTASKEGVIVEERGWALPKRKQNVRFTDNAKDFLNEKFDEGARTNKKWDPRVVSDMMKKEALVVDGERKPRFMREEWLTERQIASYFTRRRNIKQRTGCDKVCPEDDPTTEGDPDLDFEVRFCAQHNCFYFVVLDV